MKQLIAVFPVLFENANYELGDELPTHNTEFVKLWVENGTAVWKDIKGETDKPQNRRTKAKQVTAPTGLPGEAYPAAGSEQDLVGKPPARKVRGAQPEPARGRRKSSA